MQWKLPGEMKTLVLLELAWKFQFYHKLVPALVGQYSIILCKQKIKNFVKCQIESMHTWQVLRYIDLARANGEALLNILIVKWNKNR